MSAFHIDQEKCVGCGHCLKICAAHALQLQEGKVVRDEDSCNLCGLCLNICSNNALSLVRDQNKVADTKARGVWIFAEQSHDVVLPAVFELVGKGRELAHKLNVPLSAVLAGGTRIDLQTTLLHKAGVNQIHVLEDKSFYQNTDMRYCGLLHELITKYRPEIFLFAATSFGRSLAPRLAARLQTGLTADCTVLEVDTETRLLQQTRPAFGGNLMATIITPNHRPQMATVRPGIISKPIPLASRKCICIPYDYTHKEPDLLEVLSTRSTSSPGLAEARVVVAAGRGLGNARNLYYVKKLAHQLGGVMGCSRPLVDLGWCEYKYQIGQTGCAIKPKLLISCGISGAVQHVAGLNGAQTIIAINKDAQAPIFSVAHYKVVGDCVEVLKSILEKLKT